MFGKKLALYILNIGINTRIIEDEINIIEKKLGHLNSFNADDEESHQRLISLKKDCLLNLIIKQDKLLSLRKNSSNN